MIAQDAEIVVNAQSDTVSLSSLRKGDVVWDFATGAPVPLFDVYQKTFSRDQLRDAGCIPRILKRSQAAKGGGTLAVSPSQAVLVSEFYAGTCAQAADLTEPEIDFIRCTYFVVVPRSTCMINANGHFIRILGLSQFVGADRRTDDLQEGVQNGTDLATRFPSVWDQK